MRRRTKKGFSLTEVLVTLTVVGVVAALVIPQIVRSTQKDKAGMILGKAFEQVELGCQNMMLDYNNRDDAGAAMVDTLSAMDGDFEFTMESLARYIGAENTLVMPNIPGGNAVLPQSSTYRFKKFPAEMIIRPIAPNTPDDREGIVYDSFVIDVNGLNNRPNNPGVDQFHFQLRNDGKLIPVGLNSNTCDGNRPAVIDENCTARVVKDGFKIKYNW